MKDEDVKIGDHCWATSQGELLVVLKVSDGGYEVCGACECGMNYDSIELISVIEKPPEHIDTSLYYIYR